MNNVTTSAATRRRKIITTTLSPEAVEGLDRIAEAEGRSRSWVADRAALMFGRSYDLAAAAEAASEHGSFLNQHVLRRAEAAYDAALQSAAEHFSFVLGSRG